METGRFKLIHSVIILFLLFGASSQVFGKTINICVDNASGIVPLPVYVERGDDFSEELRLLIEVTKILVDGNELNPREIVATIEEEHINWIESDFISWKVLNLVAGEFPNLFYISSNVDKDLFLSWHIPEDWNNMVVEYHKRNRKGEVIQKYRLTCRNNN